MEIIDLYRADHRKSGRTGIRGEQIPPGLFMNIVFVCIFNTKGEMLIQQRHPVKKMGGKWDVSAGGAVKSGETSARAAAREVYEELGRRYRPERLTKILSVYYRSAFHDFYAVTDDFDVSELTLQESEVVDAKWASRETVRGMIENGTFMGIYAEFVDLLFAMKDRKGIMR